MSDFARTGVIATLTRLKDRPVEELEDALGQHTRRDKAALLIPLLASYQRRAEDAINSFYAVSKFNGLQFPRHEEELSVATFSRALRSAVEQFLADPLGAAAIPNWARVLSAIPDAGNRLLESVREEGGLLQP